jgi:hypothetical protein
VIRLLDGVVFNALIGNHDAHAKNFSLLYSESTPTLTSVYDLLCTAVYPTLIAKMAMKLGSNYRFPEVQGGHWQQFAEAVGCRGRKPDNGCCARLGNCLRSQGAYRLGMPFAKSRSWATS